MPEHPPSHVSRESTLVAIPSRGQRPLTGLLTTLMREVSDSGVLATIVVIDNSVGGSAHVDEARLLGVDVVVVPTPGISQARNAAIEIADSYDQLVFVDDDEVPRAGWLRALLGAQERWSADVVVGPVITQLPEDLPRWIGPEHTARPCIERPDGPFDGHVYAGNTLIRVACIRGSRARFNTEFDKSGGEDTDFFARLRVAGASVVWTAGAMADEYPDPDRLTLTGIVQRSFNTGNIAWRTHERSLRRDKRIAVLARRSARLLRGTAWVAAGALTLNGHRAVRGVADVATAAGTWSAILGLRTTYYVH